MSVVFIGIKMTNVYRIRYDFHTFQYPIPRIQSYGKLNSQSSYFVTAAKEFCCLAKYIVSPSKPHRACRNISIKCDPGGSFVRHCPGFSAQTASILWNGGYLYFAVVHASGDLVIVSTERFIPHMWTDSNLGFGLKHFNWWFGNRTARFTYFINFTNDIQKISDHLDIFMTSLKHK